MELRFGKPSVGDQLREFDLPSTTGERITLNELVGKPLVLVFSASEKITPGQKTLEHLKRTYEEFRRRGLKVHVVSLTPIQDLEKIVKEQELPFSMLADQRVQTSALYGALLRPESESTNPAEPDSATESPPSQVHLRARRRTFLVRPSMHIAKIYDEPDPETHFEQVLKDFDEIVQGEPPRKIANHAPVLLIPDILPPEFCKRLIEVWNEQGNEDSGFMKQVEGKTVGMYDYSHKIRRDHFLKESPELDQLKKYMSARIIPPIKMAFNYDVTRFEDFRIACYDSSRGGYFRPHRDNTTAGTAHRRFAMSLLLNDEYEGGALRFPEYGLNEYRPGAGSAVIFSCSLLHEALDVTAGQRFVLLSFFYGEAEAKIREAYSARTGGNYKA